VSTLGQQGQILSITLVVLRGRISSNSLLISNLHPLKLYTSAEEVVVEVVENCPGKRPVLFDGL
jgi:hypothetical protein